ncbi:MAG TPA: hypothetical protein VGY57_17015, partial [Vicinamibacterales bacterium]|nr:hypothetical protein [Vicinamibacterales bacterium]
EDEHRSRSFADQLSDALSPDPTRNTASGTNLADSISQSFANSIAGNDATGDRDFFGSGTLAEKTTQDYFDDAFGPKDEDGR